MSQHLAVRYISSIKKSVKHPYVVAKKAGQGGARQSMNHIDGIDATKGTAATWPATSIIDA